MTAKAIGDSVVFIFGGAGLFIVDNNDYSIFGLIFLLIGIIGSGFAFGCLAQYLIEKKSKNKESKWKWKLLG